MSEADDRELVSRCLAGDTESFGILVERYQRLLYNVALRMLNDPDDASDATQAAFVKAFDKLHTYKPEYKFFSWIYRIMLNESINAMHRRKPQAELNQDVPSPERNPEQTYETKEMYERVQWAVAQLPLDYRRLIVLRHFGSLSYREMSGALDIPEKTVKSRLFTARRMLRETLLKRGLVKA